MTRYSTVILLLAGALGLFGCVGVETAPLPPAVAEPREQAPPPEDSQAEIPSPVVMVEPNETAVPTPPVESTAPAMTDMKGVTAENIVGDTEIEDTTCIEPNQPVAEDSTSECSAKPNGARAGVTAEPPEPNAAVVAEPSRTINTPRTGHDADEPNGIEAVSPRMHDTSGTRRNATEPNSIEPAGPPHAHDVNEPSGAVAPVEISPALASVYADYATILNEFVRENGLVDYGGLRRQRLDLKELLIDLDELDPNAYLVLSPDEQLAFWINAYNLKMLEIIARNYPIESSWWLRLTWPPSDIRHIEGIRTDYKFIVMDEEFTLAEVESRIFRKTFGDPRVFLAITYACRSSPALRRRPYRGRGLDRQLDEQVRSFLAGPQGLQIDRAGKVVRLSALFKPSWHGKEFVDRYGTDRKFKDRDPATRAVLNFLTSYISREDVYFLETENYALEYANFDWRLNDTSRGY